MDHLGALEVKNWCISEVDMFRDLSPAVMDAIAGAALPGRRHHDDP